MAVLCCIRHGQSASNAGLVTTSPESIPLTDLGARQAAYVARAFPRQPAVVLVSPFDRTVQTSMPLRQRFPLAPVAVWPIQEFSYLAPDRYSGTRREERAPAVVAYWRRLDADFRDGPGAETFREFWERVEDFLRRCRELSGLAAVFSHGQFLRGVMLRVLVGPVPVEDAMCRFRAFRQAIAMPNAASFWLTLSHRGERLSPVTAEYVPLDCRTT